MRVPGLKATSPAVPVPQGRPPPPGPAPPRLCNRGAMPLAGATGRGAGVRAGRSPLPEGEWAGRRGAGGFGATSRAPRVRGHEAQWPSPKPRQRRARAAAARGAGCCAPGSPLSPSSVGGGDRSGAGRVPLSLCLQTPPRRPLRPARSLRRKTVPARVSCCGGGADAAGRGEPWWAIAGGGTGVSDRWWGNRGWAFASGVGGEYEGRR